MQLKVTGLRVLAPIGACLILTGCAQFHRVWHNREFAYLRQPVSQHAGLKTPPGIQSVTLTRRYTLPVGPDHYAATQQPFDMAPPDLDKSYSKAELKHFKAMQGQTATHLQPLPATKTGLEKRIAELKGLLHGEKATAASSAQPKTQTKQLDDLQKQLAAVKQKLQGLEDKNVQIPAAVHTQSVAAPVATHTAKPAATVTLPALQSELSRNDAHQAVLTVDASFAKTWQKLANILPKMDYRIRDTEKTDGVFFIAPLQQKAVGHTIVLSVQPAGDQKTRLQIYNTKGQLATSQSAFDRLHALQQHLKMD